MSQYPCLILEGRELVEVSRADRDAEYHRAFQHGHDIDAVTEAGCKAWRWIERTDLPDGRRVQTIFKSEEVFPGPFPPRPFSTAILDGDGIEEIALASTYDEALESHAEALQDVVSHPVESKER